MTINDIKNKKFDSGKRGYHAEEVDSYLDEICSYIESLEDEKANLLKKMEILARKVEEYRKDEESIRDALLGAQKLGKSVVAEAQQKADALIQESEAKSKQMLSETQAESDRILTETKQIAQELLIKSKTESDKMIADAKQSVDATLKETKYEIEKEQNHLIRTQKEVSLFKSQLLDLYRSHIDLIKKIPELELAEREAKEKETRELDKQIYEQQSEDQKIAEQSEEAPATEQTPEVPEDAEASEPAAPAEEATVEPENPAVEEAAAEPENPVVAEVIQIKSQETKEYDKSEIKNVVNPQFQSANSIKTENTPNVSTETVSAAEPEKEETPKEHHINKFGELQFGNNSK